MNIERLLELAETANDTELVWLCVRLYDNARSNDVDALVRFHGLYGKKVVAIICDWQEQGLYHKEMIESVEEPMRARLEA